MQQVLLIIIITINLPIILSIKCLSLLSSGAEETHSSLEETNESLDESICSLEDRMCELSLPKKELTLLQDLYKLCLAEEETQSIQEETCEICIAEGINICSNVEYKHTKFPKSRFRHIASNFNVYCTRARARTFKP